MSQLKSQIYFQVILMALENYWQIWTPQSSGSSHLPISNESLSWKMKQVICKKQDKGTTQAHTENPLFNQKSKQVPFYLKWSTALSLQTITQYVHLTGASYRFLLSLRKEPTSLHVNIRTFSGSHLLLEQTPYYSKHQTQIPPKQKPVNCMSCITNLLK